MIPLFLVAWIGGTAACLIVGAILDRRERARALRRLSEKRLEKREVRKAPPALIRVASEVRGLLASRLLERLRRKQSVERLLETAGLKWGATGLVHRSVACFLLGFLIVTIAMRNSSPLLGIGFGVLLAMLPLRIARGKARKRVGRFEEQFPDCLEFMARSMRAGHAFSVSLEMVPREFNDPLAGEFRRTFEEQNLGQPLEIVLQKLYQRIPRLDVQFFVAAILLQKRTGGNLAEILDKLAKIIRERFKLRARIRAVSAQGIMSGRILAAIPATVCVLMFIVNPRYASFFVDDPAGHQMIALALGLQFVGYLIIRKIVNIEV